MQLLLGVPGAISIDRNLSRSGVRRSLMCLSLNGLVIIYRFKMPAKAPVEAPEAGPPKTELQELQMKAGQVTDEVCNYNNNNKHYLHIIMAK